MSGLSGRLMRPTPDEIYRLLNLCGDEEKLSTYLAKAYQVPFATVAPIVHEWCQDLPTVPPPSRQRSAPAAPEAPSRLSLGASIKPIQRPGQPEMITIRPPPASAPASRPSTSDMMKVMAQLDQRINRSNLVANSTKARNSLCNLQREDISKATGAFRLPPRVPENAPVVEDDQAAIASYLERSKCIVGHQAPKGKAMRF